MLTVCLKPRQVRVSVFKVDKDVDRGIDEPND